MNNSLNTITKIPKTTIFNNKKIKFQNFNNSNRKFTNKAKTI